MVTLTRLSGVGEAGAEITTHLLNHFHPKLIKVKM